MNVRSAKGATDVPERPSSAPPDPLFIATKLMPPRLRDGLVTRDVLLDHLRSGRQTALTLVCAPAGYGKTTLLTQWAATDRGRTPFAWVSLDPGDSDPVRLWSHLIAALRSIHADAGEGSLPALSASPERMQDTVVARLVGELSDCPPCVLILDDWHAVRRPVDDQAVAAFIERAPEAVQIVISSRSDPSLPVPRLRAHGELTEIRARDLRLSSPEAEVLFQKANLRLLPEDVERLTERTEGWLAGLALAIGVLRRQEDVQRFIHDFAGDSRHVFDYLAQDVLEAVEPDIREFMLRSSVLERFTAPLCDAVLEKSESAAMLAEIDRSNLFLVSLDETSTEYRYHHLLEALLRRELAAADPGSIPGLHARASLWLENNGDIERAIDHAIASRDVARASALVTRAAVPLLSSGRMATVNRWFESLSWPEALADRPIALMRALTAGLSAHGRDEIERWLAIADAGPDVGPLVNGLTSIHSGVAMVRSTYLSRGIAEAERGARLALERRARRERVALCRALPAGTGALPRRSRRGSASATRRSADATWRTPSRDDVHRAVVPRADRAGRWGYRQSERLARDALALAVENNHSSSVTAANPHLALGAALMHGPDLRAALDHLEQAVTLAGLSGSTYWYVHALIRLAGARHRQGDEAGARDALALARADLDSLPDTGMLGPLYHSASEELLHRKPRDARLGDELSEAELRVLHEMTAGRSVRDTATALWLSPNTVKTHRRSIYRKLGVHTREDLADRALERGLLDLPQAGAPTGSGTARDEP